MSHPVVLYDGVCGLCNRSVHFILRRDKKAAFRFAALQSPWAATVLARHGAHASDLDTIYVVVNGDDDGEKLLSRSSAVLYVLRQLGGVWRAAAAAFRLIPRLIRDWMYGVVAQNRYRMFGKYEVCPLPTAEERERFVEHSAD
jgi:predicted DCC family thiol-disulfide oxidoreductase YuxK